MEVAQLLDGHRLHVLRPSRRSCARSARRRADTDCRGAPARCATSASGSLRCCSIAGERLALHLLERRGRERRVAQQLADQRDRRRQRVARASCMSTRDAGRRRALMRQLGLQLRRAGPGSARASACAVPLSSSAADERPAPRRCPNRLFSSPKRSVSAHRTALAARALRQQRDLHAAGEREALRARVDVGRRGVEGLGLRRPRPAA